jgi:hypothetical protein
MIIHNASKTRLYRIWHNIRQKCLNPYNIHYRKFNTFYGDWDYFEAFRDWAITHGYDESKSIERTVTKNGFNPDNCNWVFDIRDRKRNKHDLR